MRTTYLRGLSIAMSIALASSAAHAQDADGDGVLDGDDRCALTPSGAPVDPAGCARVCDARVIGSDGFARTLLTEIGVNAYAAFGSAGAAPAGYHARTSGDTTQPARLAIVANPERNGWTEHDGDYVLPTRFPEEGWGITLRGESCNNNTAGLQEIDGSVVSAECVATGLCGLRGGARVVWRGRSPSLAVEQEAIVPNEGLFILVRVALTNTTADALDEVYYLRNINPENNRVLSGSAITRSTIERQLPPLGTGAQAMVSAAQDLSVDASMTNDAYIALLSRHPSAVASFGGVANRSALAAHAGTAPHVVAEGASVVADQAISLAFRFHLAPGATVRFTYAYVLGKAAVDDALLCAETDSDFDGIPDAIDVDDDDDGVPDLLELPAFVSDPGSDTDGDGVPDWQDPDDVPGGCVDAAPPFGECDAVPAALDADGDGIPDHLDRDADGDGITDTLESGGLDADGDGQPDGCVSHSSVGGCESAPGVSLLVSLLVDTDGDGQPDLRDVDSDGDGLLDHDEAFDSDGDGVSDLARAGSDHDADGIDDGFDPDAGGAPVTLPLAAHRDADADGVGDWQEVCGDGHVTAGEACDTGGPSATCSVACLLTAMQPCTSGAECDSMICGPSGVCAPCEDTTSDGIDRGCRAERPVCVAGACELCDDTAGAGGVDEGCSTSAPECDATSRTCGPCVGPACVPDAGSDAGLDAGVDGGVDTARPVGSGITCAVSARSGGLPALMLWALVAFSLRRFVGRLRARERRGHRPSSSL